MVVAIVVGILLLRATTGTPANGSAATATTTTTTAAGQGTGHGGTTTTTTAPPNKNVKVLVANGSSTTGAAGFFTSKLTADGWGTLTATDASTTVNASAVYYASGQQSPAETIAAELGLKPSVVQPLTTSVPVPDTTGADVVVVVGPDLSSQVTTTTAAG